MGLKCGIVGLPNVGKSTIFNALTNAKAQAANFPFCTIEPNVGVITVPDQRLTKISEIVIPEKLVPTTVEIVDIAGLVKGASKGEGLGNQFLGNIKETDAILHVVRCFEDGNVIHVDGSVNPVRDKEVIDIELQLKDLETVTKTMQKYEKQAKVGSDKQAIQAMELLHLYKECLEDGRSARTIPVREDQEWVVKTLNLLTNKPILYVCNVDEASAKTGNAHVEALKNAVKDENAEVLIISAAIEADIAQLESFDDRKAFLSDLGLEQSGVEQLIQKSYSLLQFNNLFHCGCERS
jgi:GTP-binding protein YchF